MPTPFLPITLVTRFGRQRRTCRTCLAGHPRRCFSSCLATVPEISRRGEPRGASPPPLPLPVPVPVPVLVLISALVPFLLTAVEAWACENKKKGCFREGGDAYD